jgi:sigma-B regulation protein RsbU (phosphoserine phosphatase)
MLPKKFPPYPERDDLDIFGSLVPAKAVGGDLFDFFIRDNQFFFCIGDVSGKGVPASLVMAVTRSLFRNVTAHVADPGRITVAINDALSEGNERNMFVTFFVGVLNLENHELRYCNAGHNAPFVLTDNVSLLPVESNLPLGVMAGWEFVSQQINMAPDTTIFLYTDGLTEAENIEHLQFGEDNAQDVLRQCIAGEALNSEEMVHQMTMAVHAFVGEAEQSDDLTMLAIKRNK